MQKTVKDGVVRLELVEGRTGTVEVQGNQTTRADYIRDRLHLTEGKVANIAQIDRDMQRFLLVELP